MSKWNDYQKHIESHEVEPKAWNIGFMVDDFTDTVVLPELMLAIHESKTEDTGRLILAFIKRVSELEKALHNERVRTDELERALYPEIEDGELPPDVIRNIESRLHGYESTEAEEYEPGQTPRPALADE